MKKIIKIIVILLLVVALVYFIYVNYIKEEIPKKETEKELAQVSEYFIYGNHLNIKGSLEIADRNYQNIKLTLYNGTDKDIKIETKIEGNIINFNTSEYINEGIYLDDLSRGKYYLFLKVVYDNPEDQENPIEKYYILNNKTDYKDLTYYTLSKYNNKILINSQNEYNTISFDIVENKTNDNIYDITIDPGHGGMDSGGTSNDYKESDFTMDISKKIKDNLEKAGLKVKLTHEENDLTQNDVLDEYNEHGRAVIPNEVKSKYTFSIHINKNTSSKVHGVEIYTADNINYDLAKSLAEKITNKTKLDYSTNKLYKISNGVYTHNFTEKEISSSLKGYEEKKRNPYNVTTKSNYLYMIRETGGYMTGAYVDDSNPNSVGVNPYYNSNIGNESYLLEIGYISNSKDVDIISNSKNEIADAVSEAIKEELKI